MNRDTLYSGAIVDVTSGATLTIPESGQRYVSLMVVAQDHYVNAVLHEPGEHELTLEQFGTPYVAIAARILVDPADSADVAVVNALQDRLGLRAGSEQPFVLPDYHDASFTATRQALLEPLPSDSAGSIARSGDATRSTPYAISSAQRQAGEGCPSSRPTTST